MPQQSDPPVDGSRPTAKQMVRDLTTEQRREMRRLLLEHFDENAGCYLDGWSDQAIGREVGVPWAVIHMCREVFMGPIKGKTDPELA